MELEAREPMTPRKQREARIEEMKFVLVMIALRLEDAQKIPNDATTTWTMTEEIPDLVTIHEEVQKTEHEL